jgi:hypothetical protein
LSGSCCARPSFVTRETAQRRWNFVIVGLHFSPLHSRSLAIWQNKSIGELSRRLARKVLPVVVVAHRRLRIGMACMGLSSPHVAVAGVEGGL